MVRRFKPSVKYRRGSRVHGWGRVGQHRKSGSSGGKGFVGYHKHKWSYVMKYGEGGSGWPFYGKHGFKRPHAKQWNPINLSKLMEIVKEAKVERDGEGRVVVDLTAFGYDKLLASGNVDIPLVVYTQAASKRAVEKVAAAGGEVRIVLR